MTHAFGRAFQCRLSTNDPSVNDVQTEESADDDPPWLSLRGRVLLRDVMLAIRTALRVLVNLPLAIRAGDSWLLVIV